MPDTDQLFETNRLFTITSRREYTEDFQELWPHSARNYESSYPAWGESAEAVAARWQEIKDRIDPSTKDYFDAMYHDSLVSVKPTDEVEARAKVAISVYAPMVCCELAVFRPCVCTVSFSCPVHGSTCHGTHD